MPAISYTQAVYLYGLSTIPYVVLTRQFAYFLAGAWLNFLVVPALSVTKSSSSRLLYRSFPLLTVQSQFKTLFL